MKFAPASIETDALVIGAGMGGLTAAASLARQGLDITVLEAHIYPGGSAGTFYHQGYRFDAGATLAGGFSNRGLMEIVAKSTGVLSWPVRPTQHAMRVHLPDGISVDRWSDERRWAERRQVFSDEAHAFWLWQEKTADLLWDAVGRGLPWPPGNPVELVQLGSRGMAAFIQNLSRFTPGWGTDAFRTVEYRIKEHDPAFRTFLDAQLLISAQTTSEHTNALYAAAALDLPRRGVAHVQGGMGALAETLAGAIRQHGGNIVYRNEVIRLKILENGDYLLETNKGTKYRAPTVIANLTPWNIKQLLEENAPHRYQTLSQLPDESWGAMMVYVGIEDRNSIEQLPLHQQVITSSPLAEGNSIFISLSPEWDPTRAPAKHRALTISTHTRLKDWWQLYEEDRDAYETRKQNYLDRMLQTAEIALPGLRNAAKLILPATPITFQRFTRRARGWVGGFPQSSLFRTWPARVLPGLWMVGDSIFPGQSTPAVALGGLRVAEAILNERSVSKLTISTPGWHSAKGQLNQGERKATSVYHPGSDAPVKSARDLSGVGKHR